VTGRSRVRLLLAALALSGACAHTKTTDDGSSRPAEAEKEPQAKKQEKKQTPRAPGEGKGSELHPGKPDAVPVATAPEALLKPGAEDKIRERLIAGGFIDRDEKESGAAMRRGLRRFQKEHDLPATGVADHQTVKGLGLDPDQIFRQATVKD
jgi:hypothetical protein